MFQNIELKPRGGEGGHPVAMAMVEIVLVLCGVFSLMSFGGLKSTTWKMAGGETCPSSLSGESSRFLLVCLLEMGRCLEDGWEVGALRIPQGWVGWRCRTAQSYWVGSVHLWDRKCKG